MGRTSTLVDVARRGIWCAARAPGGSHTARVTGSTLQRVQPTVGGQTVSALDGGRLAAGPVREMEIAITSAPAAGNAPANSRVADGDRVREERALFARYLDRRAGVGRDVLVERFLPLARSLARRYERPSEPFDDVFQVACVGLIKAIDRFDPTRDVSFSSYATPTILGEIKRYYRDHS